MRFAPDSKIKMLLQLKESAEIVIVINASDIEKNKVRGVSLVTGGQACYNQKRIRPLDEGREIHQIGMESHRDTDQTFSASPSDIPKVPAPSHAPAAR